MSGAIQAGLVFRTTQGATALLTMVCIVTVLSAAEQGYFLTFLSILAAQQLLELGLSMVIMQVASHESVGLEWQGVRAAFPRASTEAHLAKLLAWSQRWYGGIAVVFLLAVVPAGWLVLSGDHQSLVGDSWKGPWLVAGVMLAVNIVFAPILALLEGCGRISEVFVFRSWQEVASSLGMWIGLLEGLGLYSLGIYLAVRATACLIYLARYRSFLAQLWTHRGGTSAAFAWSRDIWPLQWRISLSFGAGYLIFHLTTPIVFALLGPVAAGQWALTYLIVFSIGQFWLTWVSAHAPELGNLAAQRRYREMEALFFHDARRSIAACAAGLTIGYLALWLVFEYRLPYAGRLIEPRAAAVLVVWALVNHVVNVMAVYLRAHREEPYLLPSLAGGILVPLSVYYFGGLFGAMGIASAYLALGCLVGLGWGGIIFWRKILARRLATS